MEYINNQEFEKLNLRIGTIKAVQPHPKLHDYLLLIDLGPAEQDMQIIADLAETYTMAELVGRQVTFLENFNPVMIGGIESQGLLLIAHQTGKPVLISPERPVLTGVQVYGLHDSEIVYHKNE
ncbi:MAG: methionine--tRNA ligase [Candidatus Woesearchaeota archaeon]